jgi:hypothetical protein
MQLGLSERGAKRGAKLALKAKKPSKEVKRTSLLVPASGWTPAGCP